MHIVYFAPIAFGYLKQRPQYLAEQLARVHTVYYIEPTVSFASSLRHKELDVRQSVQRRSKRLYVIRLDGKLSLPYRLKYADKLYWSAISEYIQILRKIKQIDLVWIGYPGWYGVAQYFSGVRVVYDLMDDYVRLAGDQKTRAYLQRACGKLEKTADIILTTSVVFYEKLKRKRKHVYFVPNAMPDHFRQDCEEKIRAEQPETKKQTVFGYIGVIAEWFDNAAIEVLADIPNSRVVLAGPVRIKKIQRENVIYLGTVPKEEIPALLKSCDVCLYPFLDCPLLASVNPVKIYEYLAFQKPVIAKRCRETERFAGMASLYSDLSQLRQIAAKGARQPFADPQAYHRFAADNCWSFRGKQVLGILEAEKEKREDRK